MKNSPKISVIIPCYNQGDFLKETCNSVKQQTYTNWEAIIVNDGSTDNTENIALKICEADSRFQYYKKENGGLSSARNFGLEKSNGDYIQFLDSDDLLLPEKFSISLQNDSDLIITNFEMLASKKRKPPFCDLNNQEFNYESILLNWDIKFSIPIHCGLFKHSIAKNIKFNEKLKAKEDWYFWLDYLKYSPKVTYINTPLLLYRIHGNNMTRDNQHMLDNKKQVYSFIHTKLNAALKELFFERINTEYTKEQEKSNFLFKKYKKEKRKRKVSLFLSILLLLFSIFLLTKKIH